jgi:hypothetical protein
MKEKKRSLVLVSSLVIVVCLLIGVTGYFWKDFCKSSKIFWVDDQGNYIDLNTGNKRKATDQEIKESRGM